MHAQDVLWIFHTRGGQLSLLREVKCTENQLLPKATLGNFRRDEQRRCNYPACHEIDSALPLFSLQREHILIVVNLVDARIS